MDNVKKYFSLTILIFVLTFVIPVLIFAHGNETTTQNNNDHTAREEAEGRELWGKMQAKEVNCENLSDENFGALGEYFMGQMAGKQHEAMNNMMTQMMGEEGEERMHIVMGKRMSGCEPLAPMPQSVMDSDTMPMMNMMMGNMMGNFGAWGWLGWIFMILFWVLIAVAIIALIKWLINQIRGEAKGKSALEILKERYAKGEIDKKEFEEKKKDLI